MTSRSEDPVPSSPNPQGLCVIRRYAAAYTSMAKRLPTASKARSRAIPRYGPYFPGVNDRDRVSTPTPRKPAGNCLAAYFFETQVLVHPLSARSVIEGLSLNQRDESLRLDVAEMLRRDAQALGPYL